MEKVRESRERENGAQIKKTTTKTKKRKMKNETGEKWENERKIENPFAKTYAR